MRVPALAACLLLVFSSSGLRAQSTNASITGRVADPSKALIADAKISAVNIATNFHYETTTNSSGEYYLTNFPPGLYQLEIEKPGFKKLVKPDVALHVQDAIEINFEPSLGSATETVTVQSGAPLVNTESEFGIDSESRDCSHFRLRLTPNITPDVATSKIMPLR